ncbi:MAG: DUF2169 domain-containing protein [Polyangiaceae bacterium]
MNVKNLTGFPFGTKVTSRRPPQLEMALVVRAAFVLAPGEPLVRAGEPGDLLAQGAMSSETYRDDDAERTGEALTPDDFADFKLKADLLVRGTCHAPGGKPVTECPVAFSVGAYQKTLRVLGRRVWSDSLSGAASSAPLAFTKMPVDYAHAFGGPGFPRNPSGKGLLDELPNIESPHSPVRSRNDRPEPAGFGPISPDWPQRKDRRGKEYGEKWRKTRAPFYAEDFDWSFFNAAPPDQQIDALRGDEEVRFHNLHPKAPVIAARLPGLRIRSFVKDSSGQIREIAMRLDTLFADIDSERLYLTWRGLDPVQTDDLADVATLLIGSEPLSDKPLPASHYRDLLEAFEKDPLGLEEHRPKDLPDQEAEMARAEEKLAALTAAKEALARGGDEGSPPLTAVAGPLLKLMPAEQANDIAPHLAQAADAMAKHPPPAQPGAPLPDLRDVARQASALDPLPLGQKPGPAPPAQAQSVLKGMLQQVEKGRADLAAAGHTMPKEMDDFLSGPMVQLLADPETEGGKAAPGPGADLRDRDLSGRDLRGADLRGADLSRANLTGARLDGALLNNAVLNQTLLTEASLSGATFTGAKIEAAVFCKSIADGAVFRDAVLDRTAFVEADLRGACFDGARGTMTVFQTASMPQATARLARFERVSFMEAQLEGVDFSQIWLFRCAFVKCQLKKAQLEGASLDKTSFIDSDLTRAKFLEARGQVTGMLRCTLREADLRHSTFRSSHFSESDATRARFFAANLRESRFYRTVLDDADMSQSNLFFADLGKARLSGTKLTGASLFGAKLLQASGAGTDLNGANLRRSTLEKA